ncbi:autotransporter domain-containing protein [Novosphingobium sp. P6W]|uniref:beta strand repeat-containing protein n=1 Tax=Novosphingobium sp. P6W TaxID=1609758 RepID=UPI0006960882|nr:autotransporter domain-containing protein [Novosphingobium sp. P6W]AXB80424.1 outer membrane autotransporter [Novosphingobium sp. P6W]
MPHAAEFVGGVTVMVSSGQKPSPVADGSSSINADTFAIGGNAGVADLTVHSSPRYSVVENVNIDAGPIVTSHDDMPGIETRTEGNTVITASSVTTSGANSAAIHAYGKGDIAIEAGPILTTGYRSDGIYANTNIGGAAGNITISADQVGTGGEGSVGIRGNAYSGGTTVHAGKVNTAGYGADGIYGSSYLGNVDIDAGSVHVSGDGSRGIVAYSGGTTTIKVDDVTSSGGNVGRAFLGTGIKAVGAAVNVTAGSVSTAADYSAAIYANSNFVHDNGQALHDIAVSAGTLTTAGYGSDGVDAINVGPGGSNSIAVGSISTQGDYAFGVYSSTVSGSNMVTVGDVTTHGSVGHGIDASSTYGSVTITGDTIKTLGGGSHGVLAQGGGQPQSTGQVLSVSIDAIETGGYASDGVRALTLGRQMSTVIDVGTVKTSGDHAYGVNAYTNGTGNSITITAGTVETSGIGSTGIRAVNGSVAGDTTIDAGSVKTTGDQSSGIYATSYDGSLNIHAANVETKGSGSIAVLATNAYGDVAVNAGKVTTSGSGAHGIETIAHHSVIVAGDIQTSGDLANGVYAVAVASSGGNPGTGAGSIDIDVGNVSTTGYSSTGIRTFADIPGTDVDVRAGSVTTSGDNAWGIYASTLSGNISVDVGHVTTSGNYASGVVAHSFYGDVEVKASDVQVTGARGNSIEAMSTLGYGTVKVTAHNVTGGAFGSAIYARGASVELNLSGTITKSGSYAAVSALAVGGDLTIHNNAAITTVDGEVAAMGIIALARGDVNIDGKGTISTQGSDASGIRAYSGVGGSVKIAQSSITTSGYGSHGVTAVTSDEGGYNGKEGTGGITVSLGSITTTGEASSGLLLSDNTKRGDAVAFVSGDITTSGAFSHGASLYSANHTAALSVHGIATEGYFAQAVHLNGHADALNFTGPISTQGALGNAIVAYAGNGGIVITGSGNVTTKGAYFASGIRATSPGDINIALDGLVSTEGRGSSGIAVTERKRHSEVYPFDPPTVKLTGNDVSIALDLPGADPRDAEEAATGGKISIAARAVSTKGVNADGIMVSTTTGSVAITSGDILVGGQGSRGVFAEGRRIIADTRNTTSAKATALELRGYDSADLTVRGAAKGGTDGVALQSYANHLVVTKAGSVYGVQNGIVIDATPHVTPVVHYWGYAPESYIGDDEPQPLPPANPHPGTAIIDNSGVISAGAGYAITVTGGSAHINNAGTLMGAIHLGDFSDTFVNTGRFTATKDSDFGAGRDVFTNSGILSVSSGTGSAARAAIAPVSITFKGLERFDNSGLVDLRGGAAGDTLTLTGDYFGSGKAQLGLDLGKGVADKLVIQGAATGSTGIVLNQRASDATLLTKPIELVKAGTGTAASAFHMDVPDVGLVHYSLAYNAGSFGLTAQAGAPVYRLARIGEGAQAVWDQSAQAWSSHMAQLRDDAQPGTHVWGQVYGGVSNRDASQSIDGTDYSLDYRQDFYGFQVGVDLGGSVEDASASVFGVTAGYISSRQNFEQGGDRAAFDTVNVGAYGSVKRGAFFANALGQYAHHSIDAHGRVLDWSDKTDGNSYGVQGEVGARLGSDKVFVEPLASLAWQKADIGGLDLLGQSVTFGNLDGLTGKLGARIGGTAKVFGTEAIFYARGTYVHQFDGKPAATLVSGGTSQDIEGRRMGDYGQAALGVTILSDGPVSGFIEGNAAFGSSTKGGGGRAGVRFQF